MISKELFIEVLNLQEYNKWEVEDCGFRDHDNSIYWYFFKPSKRDPSGETGSHTPKAINIYELAHKCKEWALKGHKNCLISSNPESVYIRLYKQSFTANTEPEAIFKACQWILDQKANHE